MSSIVRILLCTAMLVVSAIAGVADVTYRYTGNYFDLFYGSPVYSTSDRITGYFTLTNPLPPSSDTRFSPISFSFTDGVQTITSSSPNLLLAYFFAQTDTMGNFTEWEAEVATWDTQNYATIWTYHYDPQIGGTEDLGWQYNIRWQSQAMGYNLDEPGSWTMTPEPSSLLCFGAGVVGVMPILRRKLNG